MISHAMEKYIKAAEPDIILHEKDSPKKDDLAANLKAPDSKGFDFWRQGKISKIFDLGWEPNQLEVQLKAEMVCGSILDCRPRKHCLLRLPSAREIVNWLGRPVPNTSFSFLIFNGSYYSIKLETADNVEISCQVNISAGHSREIFVHLTNTDENKEYVRVFSSRI